jgi:hypothetical protein
MLGTLEGPHLCPEVGGTIFNVDYYYNDGFLWEPDNHIEHIEKSCKYVSAETSAHADRVSSPS